MSDQWSPPASDKPGAVVVSPGRPAEVGEVVGIAGTLFRNGVVLFAAHVALGTITMLVGAPQLLAQAYLTITKPPPGQQLPFLGFIMVYGLFAMVVNLGMSAVMIGQARAYRHVVLHPDEPLGPVDVLRLATTRLGAVLAGVFVVGAVVLAGTCLFVIPGLVLSIALGQVLYLIAATDIEFGEAFGRSLEIVKNNILMLLLAYLGIGVAVAFVYIVLYAGIAFLGTQLLGFEIGLQIFTPIVFQVVLLPVSFLVAVPFQALSIAMETAYSGVKLPE